MFKIPNSIIALETQVATDPEVSDWPFFTVRHDRIAELASRHRLPRIYGWREFVAADRLISYDSRLTEACHQVGVYVGRILKGEKPADLPVVQSTNSRWSSICWQQRHLAWPYRTICS
jgi:hypothetical protein